MKQEWFRFLLQLIKEAEKSLETEAIWRLRPWLRQKPGCTWLPFWEWLKAEDQKKVEWGLHLILCLAASEEERCHMIGINKPFTTERLIRYCTRWTHGKLVSDWVMQNCLDSRGRRDLAP